MRVWHRGSLVFAAALAAGSLRAEVTRTLTADVSGANRTAIEVENLVGTMHVTAGTGEAVAVTATVHAESQSLADQVRLDQAPSDGGARIAVHYPESVHTLRYPAGNEEGVWFLDLFFAGESRRYQGHTFRVSHSRGRLLYVDLEVRVPARGADARLRNRVGRVEASGVEGRLAFEVDCADL